MVQCTSVGLLEGGDFSLIPDSLFRPGAVAMDTVYRPLKTSFLRKAEAAGCVAVPGVEMLLHQGVAQLVWWFGDLIRPEVVLPIMRTALLGILADEEDNQEASRGARIKATIRLPGSKSITHRALMMASLAQGDCRITNALTAEDTLLTAEALRQLGVDMAWGRRRFW